MILRDQPDTLIFDMRRNQIIFKLWEIVKWVKEGTLLVDKTILKGHRIDYSMAKSFVRNYPTPQIIISRMMPSGFKKANNVYGIFPDLKGTPEYYLVGGYETFRCILKLFGVDSDKFKVDIERREIFSREDKTRRGHNLGVIYNTLRLQTLIQSGDYVKALRKINSTLQGYDVSVVTIYPENLEELMEYYGNKKF